MKSLVIVNTVTFQVVGVIREGEEGMISLPANYILYGPDSGDEELYEGLLQEAQELLNN